MTTLYLTPAEHALFRKLPEDLRDRIAFEIQEEAADTYESPESTQERIAALDEDDQTELRPLTEEAIFALQKEIPLTDLSLDALSNETVPPLLRFLGPTGISACIEGGLQESEVTEEDLEALAHMSAVRHEMLAKP